jgi:beta-glucosidase
MSTKNFESKPALLDAQGQPIGADNRARKKGVILDGHGREIEHPVRNYGFPKDFIFGAATSAYQVEGAWNEDGKGLQIWDVFSQAPGNIAKGHDGNIACDHYHRYADDIELMKRIGLQAYRFSVSWSRVLPEGRGAVNEKGLDFYKRLLDKLNEAGIKPFLTLYHWDLPEGMHDIGGWLNRDLSHHFADYAALIGRQLGDRVESIATFNELEVILAGYVGRSMAPGLASPRLKAQAGHNLMLSHGRALQALRTVAPQTKAGIVLNFNQLDPANKQGKTVAAAKRAWTTYYGWHLDGLLNGLYPQEILKETRDGTLSIYPGDMKLISQKMDFLGINFYTRFVVDENGAFVEQKDVPKTLMGWEVSPKSFTTMLLRMKQDWPNMPPIYITENGVAFKDELSNERVQDSHRIQYLDSHLSALSKAIRKGVDVRGYMAWSLMDNLEWSLGFDMTFGLVHVDHKTQKRTVKDSGWWYGATIAKQKR